MRKYAPKMKEKAFLSILNKKFPGGACPQTPLAAWALWAQVTRPKGEYIRVTPVTTKATAVQNSMRTLQLRQKVKAIRKWPAPKNQHQMKLFLTMINYSSNFISNYLTITYPLHELHKDGVK